MINSSWLSTVSPSQTEELQDVFLSAFLAQNDEREEELTRYFQQKIIPRLERREPLIVLLDNNKIIGFALFEKWEDQAYYLAEMAVMPAYQKQGLGKKLVFSVFEKDPTTQKILLVTAITNSSAQSFYEALGFKPSSFKHPGYPEGFTGFEYIKPRLTPSMKN